MTIVAKLCVSSLFSLSALRATFRATFLVEFMGAQRMGNFALGVPCSRVKVLVIQLFRTTFHRRSLFSLVYLFWLCRPYGMSYSPGHYKYCMGWHVVRKREHNEMYFIMSCEREY